MPRATEPLYYDMIAGTNPATDVHRVWCRARYGPDHLEIEAAFDPTVPGELLKAARWGIAHGVRWPASCDPERAAAVLAKAFEDHMRDRRCKHREV